MTSVELKRAEDAIGPGFTDAKIFAMLARPGFSQALRVMVNGALAYYDSEQVMHRNMKDIGRLVLGMLALYLDATGGLSHRRLRNLAGGVGVLSAGRASAILWQLQMIGYVTPAADGPRGARRFYTPTTAMCQALRGRLRLEFEAMAVVEPALTPLLARFDEPEVFRILVALIGDDTIRAAIGSDREPGLEALRALVARTAGALIMFSIYQAADDGGEVFPVAGPITLSVNAISRRFDVSRTHVLSIVRDAERAGYIVRGDGDGVGVIEPKLVDDFQRFYAITYLGMMRSGLETVERMAAL